jgi:hypothetical protein
VAVLHRERASLSLVWISSDCAAVSVWIPPNGIEITDEEARGARPLIRDLIGAPVRRRHRTAGSL